MNAVHNALALLDAGKPEEAAAILRQMTERPEYADAIEESARALCTDELEIDDGPCFSDGEDGCWVSAWVWVPRETAKEPDEEA
ncbi:hypothetical protein SAMN04488503_2277 [Humidesulfovibrio mexicanus]|uniref:Uncharacterized protein n=1 Tax=Humidesulfovibrio mexicanus TaxID=147047 RepID=A0A239AYN1_9BACT|nr:hypothetical protein [Humidesulfovibrio mexicanus]SNS00124.1 hypothetical protein SAMN04488503_2277 [Humidesulfovibrio mexicanus]